MKFSGIIILSIITIGISMFYKTSDPLLQYLVREPTVKTAKPPIVILMHGVGSNEKDLFALASQLPNQFLVVSVRAPYFIEKDRYGWYALSFVDGKPTCNVEQAEKSRLLVIQFINQLKEKFSFDNQRVYLCGFSQGAIMAASIGLTNPDKIKGIAMMSGLLLEEVKPKIAPKENLKNLRVYISHGTNDKVLEVHYAHESYAYLKQLGINPFYKEYPNGHTISAAMLSDLNTWLNKDLK